MQRKQNKTSSIVSPKKTIEKEFSPTFYAIPITKEEINLDVQGNASSEIKVEIGKVSIYIPSEDKVSLLSIIKELAKSC